VAGAGVVGGVEHRGVGDDRQEDEDGVADHDDLVDQQHELEAVDDDHDDDGPEHGVDDTAQQVGVGDAEQPRHRTDERVTADPHRDRVEGDGGEQRQERTDDAPTDAEVRAGGDGVVGAGQRTEQAHRHEEQRADDDAGERRADGLPEREPQGDGEGAEQDGGEGVGAAELDPEQVERSRRAVGVGDRVDAVLLDVGDLGTWGGDVRRGGRGAHAGSLQRAACGRER